MASGPTLPPQAYTRETLTSAFNWLQTQPESVRKMATTPDALVGLYTRAKRFGASSLEADAPVSSQTFMSDLKNLAEGLKQFEDPKESTRPEQRPEKRSERPSESRPEPKGASPHPHHASGPSQNAPQMPYPPPPPYQGPPPFMNGIAMGNGSGPVPPFQTPQMVPLAGQLPGGPAGFVNPMNGLQGAAPIGGINTGNPMAYGLQERSRSMIQEVKIQLNLTSDSEVLNMMVAVAYKSLKNLLS